MATGSLCAGRGGRQGKFTDGAEGLRPALRRPDGACGRRGPELPGSPEPRSSPRSPPSVPVLPDSSSLGLSGPPVSPRALRPGHAAPAEPAAPGRRPRSAAADVCGEQPGGTRRGLPAAAWPRPRVAGWTAAVRQTKSGAAGTERRHSCTALPHSPAQRPGPMPLKRPAQGPLL